MARLIIGHTTESSTRIWVRGESKYPYAFVSCSREGKTRTQKVRLEERHFYTGIADFRQLSPDSEYQVSVSFSDEEDAKDSERITYGYCAGSVRTFLADGNEETFRFLLGSCNLHSLGALSNPDQAFQRISDVARAKDARFMIHCGDQIYYDIPVPWKAPNFNEYREKYLDAWGDSRKTRKFLTGMPQYMILDDHEITNDFANDMSSPNGGASPKEYRDAALKVYREFQHIRHPQQFGNQALYYRFQVGAAQYFVMDTRSERYLGSDGGGRKEMIGREQMRALRTWLKKHKDSVKFVVTSVPFVHEVYGSKDKWCGPAFRHQREEILHHLVKNEIEGTIFLTGDMHCSGHATIEATLDNKKVIVHELMSSPINQIGKSSINDFEQNATPIVESEEFKGLEYNSSFLKSEFFDGHSNAMVVGVRGRNIEFEIFRTKKEEIGISVKKFKV